MVLLRPFSLFLWPFDIFFIFGILYKEKYGNPEIEVFERR
jgi:hypothetical protein